MNAAQRVHWLAAGIILAPEKYLKPFDNFVGGRESRIRQLATFLCSNDPLPFLTKELQVPCLKTIIKLIASSFGPVAQSARLHSKSKHHERKDLRAPTVNPARSRCDGFGDLSSDAALHRWHDTISDRDRQRVVHRDAAYRHPSLEQICRTLGNQAPANPSDLRPRHGSTVRLGR